MAFFSEGNIQYNFISCYKSNMLYNFGSYAKGYHYAANTLVEKIFSESHFPDFNAYPAIFLYRHSFELYLKSIIYNLVLVCALKRIDKINHKLFNNHNVLELEMEVSKLLKTIYLKDKEIICLVKEIKRTAKDITTIDKESYSFRYPIKKDGTPSTKKGLIINLESFACHMDQLLDKLECIELSNDVIKEKQSEVYEIIEQISSNIIRI